MSTYLKIAHLTMCNLVLIRFCHIYLNNTRECEFAVRNEGITNSSLTSFPGFSPTRPTERERETLENVGHVSPRIWDITNKRFGGGAGKCEISLYRE